MFMGRYNHTIDPKGRLSIPSKCREILGDEFVVSKGMDGCLFVYANEDWKVFEEKLAALPVRRVLPAHHSLEVSPELPRQMRDALRRLKQEGKLRHGAGTFQYDGWAIWL